MLKIFFDGTQKQQLADLILAEIFVLLPPERSVVEGHFSPGSKFFPVYM